MKAAIWIAGRRRIPNRRGRGCNKAREEEAKESKAGRKQESQKRCSYLKLLYRMMVLMLLWPTRSLNITAERSITMRPPTSESKPERAEKVIEPEAGEERMRCRYWVVSDGMAADLACVSSAISVQLDHPTLPLPCHLNSPGTQPVMVTKLGRRSKEAKNIEGNTLNTHGWNRRLGGPRTAKCSPNFGSTDPEPTEAKANSTEDPESAKMVIEPEEAEERLGCRSWVCCDEKAAALACVSSATSVRLDHPTHSPTGHSISPRTLPRMVTRLGRHSKEKGIRKMGHTNTSGWNRRLGGPRTAKCSPIFKMALQASSIAKSAFVVKEDEKNGKIDEEEDKVSTDIDGSFYVDLIVQQGKKRLFGQNPSKITEGRVKDVSRCAKKKQIPLEKARRLKAGNCAGQMEEKATAVKESKLKGGGAQRPE